MFGITPQPAAEWQKALKVGDRVLKIVAGEVLVYQEVTAKTRNPKTTRQVKGYSAMASYGEVGDTYLHDMVCVIEDDVWEAVEGAGWPSAPGSAGIAVEMVLEDRDGVETPVLKKVA